MQRRLDPVTKLLRADRYKWTLDMVFANRSHDLFRMKILKSTSASSSDDEAVSCAWLAAIVLVGYCWVSSYAALNCRGLYGDASHYLLKIAEEEHFHLFDRQRQTVQVLRQTVVVVLRR